MVLVCLLACGSVTAPPSVTSGITDDAESDERPDDGTDEDVEEADEAAEETDEAADEDGVGGTDSDGDGYTPDEGDCDDDNPFAYPGANEVDNGIDDDCDGLTDEEDDGPPGGDTSEPPGPGDCGAASPEMVAITVENGGVYDFGGTEWPTVLFWMEISDADGDLHEMEIELWWDSVPDGSVDTSGSADMGTTIDNGSEACEVSSQTQGLYVQIGTTVPYGTEVDFALVVADAAGNTALPAVVTFTTPNEDGSDG